MAATVAGGQASTGEGAKRNQMYGDDDDREGSGGLDLTGLAGASGHLGQSDRMS